ncbi:unnamed protein product [Pylaiella littoralis]
MSAATREALLESFSVTCTSDFPSIGYQPGEKVVTLVRVVCTLISVSIISSWCNKQTVTRYLLFFAHWISGLVHQLAEMVLAELVSLCWAKSSVLRLIQAMKFVELVGGNMVAITNLAICVNLALIVSSHRTMSRVKSVNSPRLILGFLTIAVAAALAGAFYWETVTISGTLFWSVNMDQDKHDWVLSSVFFMELFMGGVMLVIGLLLVTFRWPELCQVWQLHRRIKYYIALSATATVVDLAIGIGGVVYVVHSQYMPTLIVATWTMRHIHIALDTLVLYSALGVTTKHAHNFAADREALEKEEGSPADAEHEPGGPKPPPPHCVIACRRFGSGRQTKTSISPDQYSSQEEI